MIGGLWPPPTLLGEQTAEQLLGQPKLTKMDLKVMYINVNLN
jgi:hypothetical protein